VARSDYIKNELTALYANRAAWASMHASSPGTTGAGEIVTVSRVPIVWNVTSVGKLQSDPVIFDVLSGTTVVAIGMWTAATGGSFVDSVNQAATFSADQTYKVIMTYTQP